MKLFLALAAIATTWVCAASASPADTRWLDAVALIESSNDSTATGDGGKARGMFQFHRDAWEDARRINPELVEYISGANDPKRSRLAATAYLTWLRQRFSANGIQSPTASQLYAAYNCGFDGFKKKYKFDVKCTPRTTRKACAKLESKLSTHKTINHQQ